MDRGEQLGRHLPFLDSGATEEEEEKEEEEVEEEEECSMLRFLSFHY